MSPSSRRLVHCAVLLAFALPVTQLASAAPAAPVKAGVLTDETYDQYVERQRLDRTWLFFGLGAGLASLSKVPLPEKTKSGLHFNLYAGVSFFKPSWIFDLGIGWFYNKVSSDDSLGTITRVITRAGMVEFSPRYRLSSEWSLGPVVQGVLGTDTSFSESPVSRSSTNLLAGLRVMNEFPSGNFLVRLGGQALTDLTISERQMWVFQALAQIGFPLGSEKPRSATAPREEPKPEPKATALPIVASKPARIVDEKTIAVTMDERLILFPTGKAEVRSPYRERVVKFTRVLAGDLDAWGRVRVEGHSDIRGRHAYNVSLSFQRASAVAQLMILNGVPNQRVEAKGFGPDRPIDPANTQVAWAKNRRVELWIADVKDVKRLADSINQIWPEDAAIPLLVDKPKPAKAAPKKAAPKAKSGTQKKPAR